MAPPQHKIDATLQAMEKAHRATADEQVQNFSRTINVARRDFEKFATAEENASRQNESAGGSLLALVENEQALDKGLDHSLEQVKESLAEMERKRMLALGAMTRLSPEEALAELSKVKEHILSLSLRVPIRADFIVHGHNISLSIFRLFEAAERAEAEVDALINAKRSLDGGAIAPTMNEGTPSSFTNTVSSNSMNTSSQSPSPMSPASPSLNPEFNPATGTYQTTNSQVPAGQIAKQVGQVESQAVRQVTSQEITQPPQVQYHKLEAESALEPSEPAYSGAYDLSENYNHDTEIDLGSTKAEEAPRPRTPTTAGMRLKKALQKSAQSTGRPKRSVAEALGSKQNEAISSSGDDTIFQGGSEEYDL